MDLRFPDGTSDAYAGTGGGVKTNVTEDDLIDALAALENGELEYIILEDDQTNTFMQAAGDGSGGYVLEYNDGKGDAMLQAQGDVTGDTLTEALSAYLNHDVTWRTLFTWQHISF